MEQQKSKLVFVASHHHFDTEGIEATPEMLDRHLWPMLDYKENPCEQKLQKLHKDAFLALTTIPPFWSKVAMVVNVEKKVFSFPHRTWGQIYLEEKRIIEFSHDTRASNDPFYSLIRWPELTKLGPFENDEEKESEFEKVYQWSSPENWRIFFFERIKKYGNSFFSKASEELTQAQQKIAFGQRVFTALAK